MPGIRRVIGIGLSGKNVSSTWGKIEVPLISGQYGDKLEVGELSMMGGQQIDEVTEGTYSTEEVTLKVSQVTWRSIILPAMPKNGGGLIRIPIVIHFSHPDLGDDSDLLDGFRLLSWPTSADNSNSALEVELKGKPRQVLWTHERKTINQLRGLPPPGAHGF